MFDRLIAPLRGLVALALLVGNTLLWCFLLLALAVAGRLLEALAKG